MVALNYDENLDGMVSVDNLNEVGSLVEASTSRVEENPSCFFFFETLVKAQTEN